MAEAAADTFTRTYAAYRWSFAVAALGSGLWLPLNAVYLLDERGLSPLQLAMYYAVMAGVAMAANLTVSGRVDRRPVFGVSVAAGTLQMLGIMGLLLPGPPGEVLAAAVASGAGNGLFFATQGIILLRIFGASALPTVYGRQYRLINLYTALGAVGLSSLVQAAGHTGYVLAFSVNAASYLVHVLNVAGPVRRVAGLAAGTRQEPREASRPRLSAGPYRDRRFRRLLVLQAVLVTVGLSQLDSVAPVLFRRVAGLPLWAVSLLLIVNPVVVVAAQGRVLRAVERVGEIGALARALLLWALAAAPPAAIMLLGGGLWLGLAALLLYGGVFALAETWVSPSIQPLVVRLAPPERVGAYSAATSLMYSLGLLAGPPVGLFVYAHAGAGGYWAFILAGLAMAATALSRLNRDRSRLSPVGDPAVRPADERLPAATSLVTE